MTAAVRKPISAIRPAMLELWTAAGMIGRATIVVVEDDLPELVMVNGSPFIRDLTLGACAYRRVRPYCIAAPGE